MIEEYTVVCKTTEPDSEMTVYVNARSNSEAVLYAEMEYIEVFDAVPTIVLVHKED